MTYFFETYGCEMNIAESAALEQLLISRGWTKASSAQIADLAVINTCSIRETAENRIIGRLGWYCGLKATREKKIGAKTKFLEEAADFVKNGAKPLTLVVTGCMAERLLKDFQKKYPFVDYVVGSYAKHRFGEIIDAIEESRKPFKIENADFYQFAAVSAEPGAFSAFVPIMHGCDNFCSYCIVPYVRGREVSRGVEEILSELDFLNKTGVLEICLIGQNVNSYRGKICGNSVFAKECAAVVKNPNDAVFSELLQLIANHLKITNSSIKWVRFMSSHPKDFGDDVIDVIAREKVFCRHIHLPAQSGSNAILQKMNRKYTREYYLDLIAKIKAKIPDVSLTTDIMVGFPGETEKDVQDTLDLMEKIRYESAMMYYYNPREGTPAAKMEQIPVETRKERLGRVIDLQLIHTRNRMLSRVGKIETALAEGVSRDDKNELLGQTERREKIAFKAEKSCVGRFVRVKITELSGNTFRGEKI